MSIRVMADSTSDIGLERTKAWGVTLIPLEVLFDEEEFLNDVDVQLEEFCQRLVSSGKLSITDQPGPETFLTVLREAKGTGDDVVVVTINSNSNGTSQSAIIVREMCEYDNIYIVDSMQVTCTMLMVVRRDLKLAEEEKSGREIYEILGVEKSHYCAYAAIGDLTYLEKGGRPSRMGTAAGSVLNLRPVITIVNAGAVRLAGMARGQHSAYAKTLKLIGSDGRLNFDREMCIGYTGDVDVFVLSKEYLEGKMDISGFVESRIGTVIDTHGESGYAVFGAYLK